MWWGNMGEFVRRLGSSYPGRIIFVRGCWMRSGRCFCSTLPRGRKHSIMCGLWSQGSSPTVGKASPAPPAWRRSKKGWWSVGMGESSSPEPSSYRSTSQTLYYIRGGSSTFGRLCWWQCTTGRCEDTGTNKGTSAPPATPTTCQISQTPISISPTMRFKSTLHSTASTNQGTNFHSQKCNDTGAITDIK